MTVAPGWRVKSGWTVDDRLRAPAGFSRLRPVSAVALAPRATGLTGDLTGFRRVFPASAPGHHFSPHAAGLTPAIGITAARIAITLLMSG